MKFATSPKPRLIGLEGAAGSGKTTLQGHLYKRFFEHGVKVKIIPEFSQSLLGKALDIGAQYGSARPKWATGLGGTLAFLADKIHLLELASHSVDTIWICDRLVTSQLVLGIREIRHESDKELTREIIGMLSRWVENSFSPDSIVIFLEAPLPVLEARLEQRLAHPLNSCESDALAEEVKLYAALEPLSRNWKRVTLDSTELPDALAYQAIKTISCSWTV